MKSDVREALIAAALRGGPFLQRVLNLEGPQDFRGDSGREVWNAARSRGNWNAAAIVARGGYQPPGEETLAWFLIRNHLAACDFAGLPAATRLWTSLHNLSSSDGAETQEFIIEVGKPWKEGDLNAALFLAAHFKKGSAIIRTICEAGARIDARWETMRDWLLDSAALTPADWYGKNGTARKELLTLAGLDQSAELLLEMELPGATPLIHAAASRLRGRVDPWIECGADPLAVDARGRTALHYSAEQANWRGVRSLLTACHSGWDQGDLDGHRPVDLAMTSQDGRVLEALLDAGSSPLDDKRDTGAFESGAALRLAVRNGVEHPRTPQGARKLLGLLPKERRYKAPDERLFRAVECYYPDLVQLLLTAGVTPRFAGPGQQTCLHAAAQNGDLQSVRLLLGVTPANEVNSVNADGHTPLHLACRDGGARIEVVEALLGAGAQASTTDGQQRSCLHLLAESASDVIDPAPVELLLKAGAKLEATGPEGNTPLACAVQAGRPFLAKSLLDAGADPNALTAGLCSPLGFCRTESEVGRLLSAGARTSCGDPAVFDALLRQASYGSYPVFDALLKALKDPCGSVSRRQPGETLLHRVAWSDRSPSAVRVKNVLDMGAFVDPKDREGQTPLMAAARYGTGEAIQMLLDAGAAPLATDNAGLTPAAHARANSRWDWAERIEARAH